MFKSAPALQRLGWCGSGDPIDDMGAKLIGMICHKEFGWAGREPEPWHRQLARRQPDATAEAWPAGDVGHIRQAADRAIQRTYLLRKTPVYELAQQGAGFLGPRWCVSDF